MRSEPRLYARLDHQTGSDHLLVCFNSYDSPADGHRTRLENFSWLSELGVSTLWFAEGGPRGWYTGFDAEIQRWIVDAADRHRLARITLLGSSCGAYASIRHALLLAGAPTGFALDVQAVAINPQTGFAPALLDAIRGDLVQAGWPAAELGANPVLPAAGDLAAGADLVELAASVPPTAGGPRIGVLFDALNPIDHAFCTRLAAIPGVSLQPHRLGLPHADGARWFWQSAAFRQLVTRRASPRNAGAEVVNLERVRLLQRYAAARAA